MNDSVKINDLYNLNLFLALFYKKKKKIWTRIHQFNGMMIKVHTCVRDCDIMFHVPLAVANFNSDNFFSFNQMKFQYRSLSPKN